MKSHESAHCSTASPLLYPHEVLWLLKSPITIYVWKLILVVGDVQLLVTFQFYWALKGLWVCVFPGGTGSDNALSCTSLIVWTL